MGYSSSARRLQQTVHVRSRSEYAPAHPPSHREGTRSEASQLSRFRCAGCPRQVHGLSRQMHGLPRQTTTPMLYPTICGADPSAIPSLLCTSSSWSCRLQERRECRPLTRLAGKRRIATLNVGSHTEVERRSTLQQSLARSMTTRNPLVPRPVTKLWCKPLAQQTGFVKV